LCTFQKIYGLGKVKLKIKWPDRLEKNTNLAENVKEINWWYYTYNTMHNLKIARSSPGN
jgi:hypothetical protein